MLYGFLYGNRRNFVKDNALDWCGSLFRKRIVEVPGYCFPFAVVIRCKQNFVGILCVLLQFLKELCPSAHRYVFGLEIVCYVYCKAAFWQVNQMPHRSLYRIGRPKVMLYGLCLSGRLHYDKRFL